MSDKYAVIGYTSSQEQAETIAHQIKDWEKASDGIKSGGIGILTWNADKGKIKTKKVGKRDTGKGAGWGTALGAVVGMLSGGATLVGGAIAGAAGGAVLGAFFHKGLGLSDEDKARLEKHLQDGGGAIVVAVKGAEVDATKAKLAELGCEVEDYQVPDETAEQIDQATDVQSADPDADDTDEREPADSSGDDSSDDSSS